MFSAMITFVVGYEAIYFINHYGDRVFDLEYHKPNRYHRIKNKAVYWGSFIILGLLGIYLSWVSSPSSVVWLIAIYSMSAVYSLPPTRLKDVFLVRFIAMGVAYALKTVYCLSLLGVNIVNIPLSLTITIIAFVAFFTTVYKGTDLILTKKVDISIVEYILLGLFLLLTLLFFSLKSALVWEFLLAMVPYTLVLLFVRRIFKRFDVL
jgi:4-hydroxybenzoate polyprenyltransferase